MNSENEKKILLTVSSDTRKMLKALAGLKGMTYHELITEWVKKEFEIEMTKYA